LWNPKQLEPIKLSVKYNTLVDFGYQIKNFVVEVLIVHKVFLFFFFSKNARAVFFDVE
jgi:hypothetical protein